MAIKLKQIEVTPRDGTSQLRRVLATLDPSYVAVDERTALDFLAFAGELGTALKYYGPNDKCVTADDQSITTFAAFISSVSASDVAAFLRNPERFDPQTSPALFRPHFGLFLVFLKLLELAQVELNALTGRHLDFYYRRFLGMVNKGAVPDRLNLIVNLATRGKEVLVPSGSLLNAGPDSLGRDRIYATDRDLVVNRAQISKLSSLFVDRRLSGFKETRDHLLPAALPAEVCLAMLKLALGNPRPGDPLPPYPDGTLVDAPKLVALDVLTQTTTESTGYYLSLSELRDLFVLLKGATAQLTANQLNDQWNKINGFLELGGQRKRSSAAYRLPADCQPHDFAANAATALGLLTVNGKTAVGVEAYFNALRELETYFFMTAEGFHQLYLQSQSSLPGAQPDPQGWDRADLILKAAYEDKVRAGRRQDLQRLHQAHQSEGLSPLIEQVMGNAAATEYDLLPFLGKAATLDPLHAAVTADDWDRVCSILEVVQSNRIGEPVAQTEQWLNLYPSADATQVGFRGQADPLASTPRWATFGLPQPGTATAPPAPVLGWAVSVPLLSLSEGERTVTLTLGFGGDGAGRDQLKALFTSPLPLSFAVSTAKGWLSGAPIEVLVDSYATLSGIAPGDADPVGVRFKLVFGTSTGAICPLPAELAQITGPGPVLRLLLQPVWSAEQNQYVVRYRELSTLQLLAVHIKVAVTGLRALKLQSDQAVLDAQKPFEPFGSLPAVGAHLLLGHPEIVQKKLDSLSFNVKWMGAPADLDAQYANYGIPAPLLPDKTPTPLQFTARVSWVDRTQVIDLDAAKPLFNKIKDMAGTHWDTSGTSWVFDPLPSAPAAIGVEGSFGDDLSTWTRYVQWELNAPDFQHSSFAAVASSKALELAAAIANRAVDPTLPKITVANYSVKPPYTPKVKSLTLDYSSSQDFRIGGAPLDANTVRVVHIHPFGFCDIEAERTAAGVPFLPQYEHDGELHLGITGVVPPQTVSLFFQLAEGTSDPDGDPQPIEWSYLDADRWVPLGNGLTLDTTRGFLNSGIVELALKPVQPSTRLQGGLYWVRAAIARNTAVVCDIITVNTQGVSATLTDNGNAPDHFSQPLPPGTLTKLTVPIPLIAGVRQPYASYGGRMAEDDRMAATRISERLRHKQRALAMWDYEQLVLERFPEVYKAKCLPAGPGDRGKVGIVIIPDIKNLLPSDPFAPQAPARLLADIQAYVATKTPAFVTVKVKNARYVPVQVRLRVRFSAEGNQSFYTQKLNDELNRFLSPWAYDEGADIVLGGKIYTNSIIDFVDRRPYVDYVAGVTLFRSDDQGRFWPAADGDYVTTDQPDAVLVAARTHLIDVLHDAVYQEKSVTGIGFMKLELDFIVKADPLTTNVR